MICKRKIHQMLAILLVFSIIMAGCVGKKDGELTLNSLQPDINTETGTNVETEEKEGSSQNAIAEADADIKISDNKEPAAEENNENPGKNEENSDIVDAADSKENEKEPEKTGNDGTGEKEYPGTGKDNSNTKNEDQTSVQSDKSRTATEHNNEHNAGADENEQKNKAPDAKSVFEKRVKGLSAYSAEELKILLDEIYPGDSLTQEMIDTYPAEKLYEYFGKKYSDTFYDYVRTSEKVIDNSTVECEVTVVLSDGTKNHKVRLKMDANLHWNVIYDDIVQ